MIIEETYDLLRTMGSDRLPGLTISKLVIGARLTAVRLSDGSHGVASTLPHPPGHASGRERDFGEFSPARITGSSVVSLFETPRRTALTDTLKVAVLNAISSTILENGAYNIIPDKDPIELIDLQSARRITVVGAFQSYIRRIAAAGSHLRVLELNPHALTADQMGFYVPAGEYASLLPSSDVVIITGMTLVNNTIEGLLEAVTPGAEVIVTGPSGSIIPDVLFRNKVTIIGATRITRPGMLFRVVSEGGSGYHLFRYCARKICVMKEELP